MIFRNSPAVTRDIPAQGGIFTFDPGAWSNLEIERIDVALGNLHQHTGNTRLLKTSGRGEMTLLAVGKQHPGKDFNVGGWNDGSEIAFVDPASKDALNLARIVYHEFGHNWHEQSDNRHIDNFRKISGWRELWFPLPSYTQSTAQNDNWWYLTAKDNTFARAYGKTNPKEDYCTTWESYFIAHYHGLGALDDFAPNIDLTPNPTKWSNLDQLFADIRPTT